MLRKLIPKHKKALADAQAAQAAAAAAAASATPAAVPQPTAEAVSDATGTGISPPVAFRPIPAVSSDSSAANTTAAANVLSPLPPPRPNTRMSQVAASPIPFDSRVPASAFQDVEPLSLAAAAGPSGGQLPHAAALAAAGYQLPGAPPLLLSVASTHTPFSHAGTPRSRENSTYAGPSVVAVISDGGLSGLKSPTTGTTSTPTATAGVPPVLLPSVSAPQLHLSQSQAHLATDKPATGTPNGVTPPAPATAPAAVVPAAAGAAVLPPGVDQTYINRLVVSGAWLATHNCAAIPLEYGGCPGLLLRGSSWWTPSRLCRVLGVA